jgi:regulator of replication initiation timing
LVGKQNATSADLAEAKKLVSELNGRIDEYVKEIERLQTENKQLTVDKENLTTENKNLNTTLTTTEAAKKDAENKVDVGSTLHASAFKITPINEKNSGKEKSTASAKRADKMRISFNLDENRIATSGPKQLFIIAKDPSGKVIKEDALASGSINTRQDGQVDFTTKIDIEYKQGEAKNISFDLRQTDKYMKGNYAVIVYQNGFKIGEGIATLK